jgi:hypothetical protein
VSWVVWVRQGVGPSSALLLAALWVSAGCQQLLGIEDVSEGMRPAGGATGAGGSRGGAGNAGNAGAMPGTDGGEDLPPYLPEGGTCVLGVPARCTSANGLPGLCTPNGCIEYCILNQSLLDQCLLR